MNWIFEIYGDTYKALSLQGGLEEGHLQKIAPGQARP